MASLISPCALSEEEFHSKGFIVKHTFIDVKSSKSLKRVKSDSSLRYSDYGASSEATESLADDSDSVEPGLNHVIWGESSAGEQSGSQTKSGSDREKRKIKNKQLSRDLRDAVLFRSRSAEVTSDSSAPHSSVEEPEKAVGAFYGRASRELLAAQHARAEEIEGKLQEPAGHGHDDQYEPDSQDDAHVSQVPRKINTTDFSLEQLAELKASVRRDNNGQTTSVGSASHPDTCKPCLFMFTKLGCTNGILCTFCHFKHKRGNRPRPCKGKRNRYRNLMERMEQLHDEGASPDGGTEAQSTTPELASNLPSRALRPESITEARLSHAREPAKDSAEIKGLDELFQGFPAADKEKSREWCTQNDVSSIDFLREAEMEADMVTALGLKPATAKVLRKRLGLTTN